MTIPSAFVLPTDVSLFEITILTNSAVPVSAQLVMEDVNVWRACDPLDHLDLVDLCDFLDVIGKRIRKNVHPESCSDRDPHAQLCH